MKKIFVLLCMMLAIQTAGYADFETDKHQAYIAKNQAQGITYNTYNFFNAISNGNVQLVDLFLKAGMSPESTFMKAPAIYMAISSNQNEIVKMLLDNKVDPNTVPQYRTDDQNFETDPTKFDGGILKDEEGTETVEVESFNWDDIFDL